MLMYFWGGSAFYAWRAQIVHHWAIALAAAAILLLGDRFRVLLLVLPFAGAYLLFWIAIHPRIHLKDFGRYGDFSYGTYLYAFPIQQLAVCYLPHAQPLALAEHSGVCLRWLCELASRRAQIPQTPCTASRPTGTPTGDGRE
jgi:peptidoglycan/LPS O-acetylase OafA/YrhL